jgi:simple sugar transport system substrate-binding protein
MVNYESREEVEVMRHWRHHLVLIVLVGLLLVAIGCLAPVAPSQAPAATEPSVAVEAAGEKVEKVAVLLPASQTDHGWNQQAADGMSEVAARRGFEVEVAENLGYEDITPVLHDLADRGFDLLICHADGYQTVCPEFAHKSGVKVVVVENPGAVTPELISDLETQAAEVAYLAGVLAGKLTKTDSVGIVVSGEPPTWNFMSVGFAEGLHVSNPDARLLYGVIGEAAYEDAAGAKRTTESQLAAGADIIFGMGDGASFGMMQAIAEHNAQSDQKAWFIDVIGDKRDIDESDLLLTSVLFDYTGVYNQMIDDIEVGDFGQVYMMDIESGGVRLLELPESVPAELAQAVEDARAAILAGDVTVSTIADAEGVHARLDELFP